jgi:hypothetical protein
MDSLVLVDCELHEEIGEECNATQSASLMLYAGMQTAELQSMLAAVFGISNPSSVAGKNHPHDKLSVLTLSYSHSNPA